MRLDRVSFVIICLVCSFMCTAQTQNGYVKTRGRLSSDGKIVPGIHLAEVLVKVKDRNTVISKNDGSFSLRIPKNKYVLEKVEKNGYVLADPESLSKEYERSDNPLVLVMDVPNLQLEDKLRAERKIRRTLQRKLQEREDIIEALLAQHKIDSMEYQNQLQELYVAQEKDERLINGMAKRFSEIDYDQLDEFNQKINTFILNGELSKADSLLKTKGDLISRAKDLKSLQQANDHMEEKLEKSKAYAQKELDDLSEDCFNRFQILRMQHQNDSAAYYICLMADLDTTKVYWQIQAAHFLDDIAEYNRSISLCERALKTLQNMGEGQSRRAATCMNSLGVSYQNVGRYDEALAYMKETLTILNALKVGSSQDFSTLYNNMASVYADKGQYDLALEYYEKAIKSATDSFELSTSYNNAGLVYKDLGKYNKALSMFLKSSQIDEEIGEYHSSVYNNMGITYISMGNYTMALANLKKSLELNIQEFGESHPNVSHNYFGISDAYLKMGEYKLSLEYALKAMGSAKNLLNVNHPDVALLYSKLGLAYKEVGDSTNAFVNLKKGVEIFEKLKDSSIPMKCMAYNNLGLAYIDCGKIDMGMEYFNKALDLYQKDSLNNNESILALVYNNIGMALMKQKEYLKAREYLMRGKDLLENTKDKNVDDLILIYSNIALSYSEMNQYNPPVEYDDYVAPSYGYMTNCLSALEYYDKCLVLLDSIHNDLHPWYGHIYFNMGDLYGATENYSDALSYYLKSLPIEEKKGKLDELAKLYYNIACLYTRQIDYDNALDYFMKTINLLLEKEGGVGSSTAEVYEDIGSVYDRKGDHQAAIEYFKKSLDYFNLHPEGHEDFIKGLKEYIDYYGKASQ